MEVLRPRFVHEASCVRLIGSVLAAALIGVSCGSANSVGSNDGTEPQIPPASDSYDTTLGSSTQATDVPSSVPSSNCEVPDGVTADALVEGRRGEAIVLLLTGIDEESIEAEQEGVEIEYDDPNFGGVWGDQAGGWVVAVLDCGQLDLSRIAELAGGSSALTVVEVAHSFEEVNGFRDLLLDELAADGVPGDVLIDSTLSGRRIRVVVEDPSVLAPTFGGSLDEGSFTIEAGTVSTADAG